MFITRRAINLAHTMYKSDANSHASHSLRGSALSLATRRTVGAHYLEETMEARQANGQAARLILDLHRLHWAEGFPVLEGTTITLGKTGNGTQFLYGPDGWAMSDESDGVGRVAWHAVVRLPNGVGYLMRPVSGFISGNAEHTLEPMPFSDGLYAADATA